jgi:transposase
MEKTPHAFGYGKSAWTAPLLARYLQDTRGLEAPLPAVRKALKDLGYRWEQTRYVKARAGVVRDRSASDGMG